MQAIELDPTEITFYSNLAAVYFEKKDYGECVKTCETAIEIGKEHRADFKLMAKAYNRAGNAYRKMGNLTGAKTAFEKALTEHRTPEYKANLSEVKKKYLENLNESNLSKFIQGGGRDQETGGSRRGFPKCIMDLQV